MSEKLSMPQERLLRWLGNYSASLEKAWDVTREISLPGISESLGVVRSALNVPLTQLEKQDLVFKRMAHVIGGGSRRRNVYHLTEEGRKLLSTLGDDTSKPRKSSSEGRMFGDAPTLGTVYGRSSLIDTVFDEIHQQHCLFISGLPGIGKTTVGLAASGKLVSNGLNVRWCTANEYSDFETLCHSMSILSELPSDANALAEHLAHECKDEVLVFDDVHMISSRHLGTFIAICQHMEGLQGPKMMFIGRETLPGFEAMNRVSIPPLEAKEAAKLLGKTLPRKESLHIAERLGGHPLALQLYQQDTTLPEENADIQSYVEDVVLSTLDAATRSGMDHLVLLPQPVEAKKAYDDEVVGTLDDYAFLRWTSNMEKMEIQHLVRNVRRTSMSSADKQELHRLAVTHWESCAETVDDYVVLLFHRICAQSEELDAHCTTAYDRLSPSRSSALSVLLEQAIEASNAPSHLHYLAAKIALDRCEPKHAHRHLTEIEDEGSSNQISIGLAYLEGRLQDAEKSIEKGFELGNQHQKNQLALSAASRRLDDRISTTLSKDAAKDIKRYLSHIVLPEDPEQRAVTVVALTMVQHAIALAERDFSKADTLRANLSSISSLKSGIIMGLEAKSTLIQMQENPTGLPNVIESTLQAIDVQPSPTHQDALRLSLVEALLELDVDLAQKHFKNVTKPNSSPGSMMLHRLHARWWFCKSHLHPSLKKVALKEAITQHRAAGCPRAANHLEALLHSLL
jgi:DNA-binding MarR family transcriptional regulator